MDTHKSFIEIDYLKCSPCSGLVCIGVCPLGILEASANKKPQIIDVASCNLCGVCVNLCPTKAIIVNPNKAKKHKQ